MVLEIISLAGEILSLPGLLYGAWLAFRGD
jgi:hypothetical protein